MSYEDMNIESLVYSLGERYKVDLRVSDLSASKKVSKNGTIRASFNNIKTGSRFSQLVNSKNSKGSD